MRRVDQFAIGVALVGLLGIPAVRADVVAVVSSRSPVVALSKLQTADIFLGKTTRFPDGTLATPLDQVEGSGVRNEFYLYFTGKSAAQVRAHWSKVIFTGRGQPPNTVASSAAAKRALAQNPSAIGYLEREQVDDTVRILRQQ